MSRITNAIRESISRKAIAAAFETRKFALKERQQALGMEAYQTVIPEAERNAASNMPEHWLQKDSCLRFNANGWDARLEVDPAVPVPYNRGYCHTLDSLTGRRL